MKQSPDNTERPPYGLLRKLAPSRWGSARQIRAEEEVHRKNHELQVDNTRKTVATQSSMNNTALQIEPGNAQSHSPCTSGVIPVPMVLTTSQHKHVSTHRGRQPSTNREALNHQLWADDLEIESNISKSLEADHRPSPDEISHGFDAFDDELLQPEQDSQVAGMVSLFPTPARSSIVSNSSSGERRPSLLIPQRSAQSIPESSPRGRSLKTSSKPTAFKSSSANSWAARNEVIAPLSQRVQSPSTSHLPSSVNGPSRLSARELVQLHVSSPDKNDILNTEINNEDDPDSWDVVQPSSSSHSITDTPTYSLERRAEELYSAEHLEIIMQDRDCLHKFSQFLHQYRPWREPILAHYLNAVKAMKALSYANALTSQLADWTPPYDSVVHPPESVRNMKLDLAAKEAFDELLRDDLHYYIAHTWTVMVSSLVLRRVTGTLVPHLREVSTGIAEVFVITDPNREDSPIILASEMFSQHSGCSLEYIIGRNCRFLQGPCTTVDSVRRFAISNQEAKDHTEIIVNYRRDGTPFLSLVMNAPLLDRFGKVRYFLGAQVDVSGLLKNCSGLESLSRLVEQRSEKRHGSVRDSGVTERPDQFGSFKALSETFSAAELALVRKQDSIPPQPDHKIHDMEKSPQAPDDGRLYLADGSESESDEQNRPSETTKNNPIEWPMSNVSAGPAGAIAPHLIRITYTARTWPTPDPVLAPHWGNSRMRQDLDSAFRAAKPVTARVRWLNTANEDGEGDGSTRWLHCTPLLHHTKQVGMWMVVIVQPDSEVAESVYSDKSSGSRLRGDALERPGATFRR